MKVMVVRLLRKIHRFGGPWQACQNLAQQFCFTSSAATISFVSSLSGSITSSASGGKIVAKDTSLRRALASLPKLSSAILFHFISRNHLFCFFLKRFNNFLSISAKAVGKDGNRSLRSLPFIAPRTSAKTGIVLQGPSLPQCQGRRQRRESFFKVPPFVSSKPAGKDGNRSSRSVSAVLQLEGRSENFSSSRPFGKYSRSAPGLPLDPRPLGEFFKVKAARKIFKAAPGRPSARRPFRDFFSRSRPFRECFLGQGRSENFI
ncbi:unnamed protein product [Nezara viridula]|uniref:Uncharacterized protein n=1 Tax=Nezara viridula TaxID=85310 RepID=A0A9P0MZ62_NEZVI|nr:unnamed protein product [Nezara viridula]